MNLQENENDGKEGPKEWCNRTVGRELKNIYDMKNIYDNGINNTTK